jgi:hypothetical protein
MNEEFTVTRQPVSAHELQQDRAYAIKGHWLGDFTAVLTENTSWLYWNFRVINVESGKLRRGQIVEIGYHHARFFAV